MAVKFELTAESRVGQGTGASRRLRRAGKVPAVIYGGGKDAVMLSLDHNAIYRLLGNEAFHTSILDIKTDNETDQAILRDVQMHPYKPLVLHLDLQRVSATEKLHVRVPLHFSGGDVAPGVKQQGGIVSHLMTEVDVTCLPKDMPEFLTADLSALHIGETVHLSDLPLPEGVALTALAHGGDDLAVAAIMAIRGAEEEVAAPAAPEAAAAAPTEEKKEG